MSYGRRKIYSDAREITAANVKNEVNKAYAVHCQNQSEPPMRASNPPPLRITTCMSSGSRHNEKPRRCLGFLLENCLTLPCKQAIIKSTQGKEVA